MTAPDANPEVLHVVIQPTPFCNIDCSYCYLPMRSDKRTMALETVKRVFENIFASGWCATRLHIVWHAGEPLVLPPSYYEAAFEAIEQIKPSTTQVTHGFNSNGILINDDWCAFLSRHRPSFGLSIDGPADLHDRYRVTRSGQGTFDAALRGLRRLQEHGIDFYVISVLTRPALQMADELYDFYVAQGISKVCFNVEEIEGVHTSSSLQAEEAQAEFEQFLHAFWGRMVADGGKLWVREFEQIFGELMRDPQREPARSLLRPLMYVNVDWQGRYSTFSPELLGQRDDRYGDFLLGDLTVEPLTEVLSKPNFRRLVADIGAGIEACRRSCEYFDVCGGGAPTNKLAENGDFDSTETVFCRMKKKAITNVGLTILESVVSHGSSAFLTHMQDGEGRPEAEFT